MSLRKKYKKHHYKVERTKYIKVSVLYRDDDNGGHPHLIYRDTKDGNYISVGLTHNYRNGVYPSTYSMSRDCLVEPSYLKDYAIKDKKEHYRKDLKHEYAYLSKKDYRKFKKSVRNFKRGQK